MAVLTYSFWKWARTRLTVRHVPHNGWSGVLKLRNVGSFALNACFSNSGCLNVFIIFLNWTANASRNSTNRCEVTPTYWHHLLNTVSSKSPVLSLYRGCHTSPPSVMRKRFNRKMIGNMMECGLPS
eukprot:3524275-Amphidinium_carterae.1